MPVRGYMAHSSCHSQVPSLDSTLSPPLLLLYNSSSFCLPYSPLSVPELSLRLAQRLFIQYGAPLLGRLVMPSHLIGYSPHVQPLSGSLGRISNFCTVHWPGKPGRRPKTHNLAPCSEGCYVPGRHWSLPDLSPGQSFQTHT